MGQLLDVPFPHFRRTSLAVFLIPRRQYDFSFPFLEIRALTGTSMPGLPHPIPFMNLATTKFYFSKYSAVCFGTDSTASGFEASEDCLTLNIIRPEGVSEDSKLAVVVWIHGGGFWGGSASDPQLNGSYIVQHSSELDTPIVWKTDRLSIPVFAELYRFSSPSNTDFCSMATLPAMSHMNWEWRTWA